MYCLRLYCMNTQDITTYIIQAGSFIATFAAIAAMIIMFKASRKFKTGLLSVGFKAITIGIVFIAIGNMLDILAFSIFGVNTPITTTLIIIKQILFVCGTYAIVIGSKKTGDKLESLTQ